MKRLLLALLCISQLSAMELIEHSAVSSASNLKLYTNHKDFFVEDDTAAYRVERHDMNPLLREVIQRKALNKFVGDGYVRINKLNEAKYSLAAKVRGNGGGPVTGWFAGLTTRIIGYSGLAVAIIVHPTVIAEAHLITEIIESSAVAATTIGLMAPTP